MSIDRESTSPPSHPLSRDTTTTLSSTTNPGTPTPGDFVREESPLIPDKPPEPPSSIRLHSLPVPSRRALSTVSTSGEEQQTRSREVLMPVTTRGGGVNIPAASPAKQEEKKGLARPQGDPDKPKGKETAPPLGAHKMSDSVEYAYEYVPVVQTREGRDKINYEMIMRQEPVQARMCGVGEKSDRRPVDPTPIVQLKVTSKAGDDLTSDSKGDGEKSLRRPEPGPNGASFMQNPYYFLFACLVGGDEQDDELHVIDDGKTRFLTGTPVSSLYHLKDTDQSDAAFFVFPDLGVRKEGRYKLKLTLFEIVDQEVFYCTTKYTATFDVYSAKKFPGMKRATELSATFADQGLKIRVRKDPRQRSKLPKSKRKSSGNDSQSETSRPLSKRSRGPQTRAPVPVFPEHQRYPDPVHNPYVNPPRPYPSVSYLGRNMPPPPIPGELPGGQYSPYPPGYGVYGGAAYQQEVTSRQRPATSFHPGYSDEAFREQEARQHRSRGEVFQTHPSVPWPQSQSQSYGRPTSASTSRTRPLTGPPADGRVYGSPMDYPRSPVQMNGHGPRPIYQDQNSYGHHPRSPSSNHRREPSPSHGPPPRSAPPFEHYHMRQPDGPPSAGPTSRDRMMHGPPALPTFYARQNAEDGAPGVSPRLAPSPYTSPSGTKQASAKSSVVLPSISTLHSPMPVPSRTDSMGKISSDSAANSPVTTPGGTRPTNKMGLGHLVD